MCTALSRYVALIAVKQILRIDFGIVKDSFAGSENRFGSRKRKKFPYRCTIRFHVFSSLIQYGIRLCKDVIDVRLIFGIGVAAGFLDSLCGLDKACRASGAVIIARADLYIGTRRKRHVGKPKALRVVGFAKGRRTVVGGSELVEVTFAVIACAD